MLISAWEKDGAAGAGLGQSDAVHTGRAGARGRGGESQAARGILPLLPSIYEGYPYPVCMPGMVQ
jgi:hypothetical protein